jgi:P2 family phage contractile tail tube protein
MAISGIPEVIHDFNIYNGKNKIVGLTGEVSLPDFEAVTETISGAGILGEIDTTIAGRYGSMEQEIPFRCIDEDFFKLISPTQRVELTLRGAIQYNKKSDGSTDYMGMRVVYRGRCKKISLGTVKQGGPMDSSITIELTYILIEMDGRKKIELDKINGVFKVNGTDLLAAVKKLT